MTDPFDLQRFVTAQADEYDRARTELRAGAKRGHWMWFIFPQLSALGHSATAKHFGITSLDEARAYLAHPVLGARLRECARLVTAVRGRTIDAILGYPDNLKLRSSMTLFARAADDNADFVAVLDKYYDGEPDRRTLELL